MISILLGILAGLGSLIAIISFISAYSEQIVDWLNNSIEQIMIFTDLLPVWVVPYVLVAIAVALVSLGVKLL